MFTVYVIKNNLQGRTVYVGKTNDFERRVNEHLSLSTHTKEWIASIGVENISITPIAEFNSKEEALKCEDEMILKYNTIEDGFNKNRSGLIAATDNNAYQRQYYETNKADRLEYQNRYNEAHRKKVLEYQKQYDEEHKDEIAEYQKQYQKQYYQEHKDEIREYKRQYYQRKKAQKQLQLDISNTPNGQFVQLTIPF